MHRKSKKSYNVNSVAEAKKLAKGWLEEYGYQKAVTFGLPEIDDRYDVWRVPIVSKNNKHRVGEVIIDALTTLIDIKRTTKPSVIESRLVQAVKAKPSQ